ncbi:hypothetical protein [Flavobacterium ovatum]|uniref:hypothetical protein n=1 Tax=Flavobacterium ovatum TaxID=1928857 RepID=UPI0034509D85
MKKYFIISAMFVLALFSGSCTEDYEIPYNDYDSFTWWASPKIVYNTLVRPDASNNGAVAVGKYVAFQDLSKGALTHEWSISAGNSFLTTEFTEADTANYERFINPNLGLVTTDKLVYVLFQTLGVHQVKIKNTYSRKVIGAVQVNGVWTAEAIITITVGPVVP